MRLVASFSPERKRGVIPPRRRQAYCQRHSFFFFSRRFVMKTLLKLAVLLFAILPLKSPFLRADPTYSTDGAGPYTPNYVSESIGGSTYVATDVSLVISNGFTYVAQAIQANACNPGGHISSAALWNGKFSVNFYYAETLPFGVSMQNTYQLGTNDPTDTKILQLIITDNKKGLDDRGIKYYNPGTGWYYAIDNGGSATSCEYDAGSLTVTDYSSRGISYDPVHVFFYDIPYTLSSSGGNIDFCTTALHWGGYYYKQ